MMIDTLAMNTSTSILILMLVLIAGTVLGQTVGLTYFDERAYEGYPLYSPFSSDSTFLINNEGRVVHAWGGSAAAMHAYLLEDGSILRAWDRDGSGEGLVFAAGGDAGFLDKIDWEGNLLWRFEYHTDQYRAHHDIEPLPNGNVLMIAWEYKSMSDFVEAGGDSTLLGEGELWPDHIVEVRQTGPTTGELVWEWHVWDHLVQDHDDTKPNFGVVSEHAELIDLNSHPGVADWNHLNAIDYNPELDQIALSSPTFNELWIIDHSTTTEEAAGHTGGNSGKGGDLLYRWGNPREYGLGIEADQLLFFQHDVQWIGPGLDGEGNLLLFNNRHRTEQGDLFSTVDELKPPLLGDGLYELGGGAPFGPEDFVWTYRAPEPTDFAATALSGAQRLPNRNTLICNGARGQIFEVTPDGETVWRFTNPFTDDGILAQGDSVAEFSNLYFKCNRYPVDFPAFDGRDLTPGRVLHRQGVNQVALSTPIHAQVDVALDPVLSWNAVDGATAYRLQLSESLNFSETLYDVEVGAPTSYRPNALKPGTTYYWRVLASNGPPDIWSDPQRFTTILTTAQEGLTLPGAIAVGNYPNPFSSTTRIQFDVSQSTLVSLRVFDALGKVVFDAPSRFHAAGQQEWRFDGSNLPAGVYLYRLETRTQTVTGTMMVAR